MRSGVEERKNVMNREGWDELVVPYPPQDVARYREAGVWGTRTIMQEMRCIVDEHPDALALITQEQRLTYAELDQRADLVAAGLLELGLQPGEPALLQCTNTAEAIIAWYGLLKAGLVPVCTLPLHRRHEISQIAQQTKAVVHVVEAGLPSFDLIAFAQEIAQIQPTLRHVLTIRAPTGGNTTRIEDLGANFTPAEARQIVNDVQAAIDPDAVAVFQLSGGTTNVPKVIPRLHAEYWYNARAYASFLHWDATSRVAFLGPIVHNAGIVCGLHGVHSVGASLVLGSFDPRVCLPLLRNASVTHLFLFPGIALQLLEDPQAASAFAMLQQVMLAGARVPLPLFDQLEEMGIRTVQMFGMGEGMCLVTRPESPRAVRALSVGETLSPLDEVRILEPDSESEVPHGVEGELCCRGPYTIRGYFNAVAHNTRAFTSDGFYRTGDIARVQIIEGVQCYSIEGRIKDLVSRGNEKINAEEIEMLLGEHPAIQAAALVAMPDKRLGERACAYLIANSDEHLELPAIQRYLQDRGVAKYKWPERLEYIEAFPLTPVGKVSKKALREDMTTRLAEEAAQKAMEEASHVNQ
jgi:2,3-dihydroxybenzoate-AMP ligase